MMRTSNPTLAMSSVGGRPPHLTSPVRRLASALALCAAMCVIAPTVQAAPLAQSTGAPSGGDCFLGGLIGGLGSIPGAIAAFPNDTDFLLRTPEALSYRNDQVQQFVSATRLLANGLLAVVVLVGGFNVLTGPYLRQPSS